MEKLITDREWLYGLKDVEMSEELMAKTLHKIEVMERNTKAPDPNKDADLIEAAYEFVATNGEVSTVQVAEALEINAPKATYVLGRLFKDGRVEKGWGEVENGRAPRTYKVI